MARRLIIVEPYDETKKFFLGLFADFEHEALSEASLLERETDDLGHEDVVLVDITYPGRWSDSEGLHQWLLRAEGNGAVVFVTTAGRLEDLPKWVVAGDFLYSMKPAVSELYNWLSQL